MFIFAATFLFAFSETDAQPRIDVMVVGVSDGDTITVKDSKNPQIKVRLAGIDAPEKGQDFADRSKQNLSDLVFGKTVLLEGRKVDRYGRLVVKVLVNGIDINLQQVRSGLAWHFKAYESEQSAADRRFICECRTRRQGHKAENLVDAKSRRTLGFPKKWRSTKCDLKDSFSANAGKFAARVNNR